MTAKRVGYAVKLIVNGCQINQVVIDQHYKVKHPDIDDRFILKLVQTLDEKEFQAEDRKDDWEFFMLDQIPFEGKKYRLVWCMQDHSLLIGVINCFRRGSYEKNES